MSKIGEGLYRTHHCGELRKTNLGETVRICGWINKSRDLGGLFFIDLRDKYGLVQLGFESYKASLEIIKKYSLESVVLATGKVCARPTSACNKQMQTGEIEVQVEHLELLSAAEVPPFLPCSQQEVTETLRLKHRYLDLRRPELQKILKLRSEAVFKIRGALLEEDFLEVETPILYKSTPEGARDYIVPSRVHPGKVYALPQSPQTLKQLLMIGSTDKYFQICRCFRDEDLRADRQPEFTQIDLEASFAKQEYIKKIAEKFCASVYGKPQGFEFPVLTYQEAMDRYGSDKPDLRYGLEQQNVTEVFKGSGFSTFSKIAEEGGLIKAMFVPESLGQLARKQIDAFTDVVKPHGGKGVAWFKHTADGRSGGISKFIDDGLFERFGSRDKGLWLFLGASNAGVVHACADALRRHLARILNLLTDEISLAWIKDFPMFEYDEEEGRFFAKHHPFTMPHREDYEAFMQADPQKDVQFLKSCRAEAYDVICNGYELGSGSERIFANATQKQMFRILGMSEEEASYQFGFFMEALQYGTPPHAGIALGIDRMVMILAGTDSITDVIAFPKTTSASDLMADCPSYPADKQLQELHLNWVKNFQKR